MFSKANKAAATGTGEEKTMAEGDETPTKKAGGRGRGRAGGRIEGVPSIVSSDMVIKGSIESQGEVQFDGEIEGDIRAKGLVIGDGAKVDGEVFAEKVRISGTVEGSIHAVEVELAATAYVKGDITHKSLTIESGARFDGSSQHSDDPLSGTPNKAAPKRLVPATVSNASATEVEPMEDDEIVEPQAPAEPPRRQAPRADASRSRELMPARNERSPARNLLKRPSASTLR